MENFQSDFELKNLVQELTQGWEHAKQLQLQLNEQSSSSYETPETLLQKIMVSYDHALSMLKHNFPGGPAGLDVAASPGAVVKMSDSPRPHSGSPHSYDSDKDFKDKSSGKRMSVQRWTEKVRVCGETGLIEGQLNDCHSWRKYGQKDILRAKYPREYYRCTHRHSQCCLATKQVQRSDDDPTIFEITYIRKHTCNPPAKSSHNLSLAVPDPQNGDPNPLPSVPQQNQHEEQILSIQKSLRVTTPGLATNENPLFETFCFPSSSSSNPIINHFFSDGFSPNLMSPAASGSNEFLISPNVVNYDHGGLIPNNSQVFGSELGPIVAAMTFGASSPTVDVHDGSPKLVPDFSLKGKKH